MFLRARSDVEQGCLAAVGISNQSDIYGMPASDKLSMVMLVKNPFILHRMV